MEEAIAKLTRAAIGYVDWLIIGVPAMLGAMAKYLYDNVRKGKAFSFVMFSTNIFLAFFAGNVVYEFLPADFSNEGGVLMVTGFCTYPVLELIEHKAAKTIEKLKQS